MSLLLVVQEDWLWHCRSICQRRSQYRIEWAERDTSNSYIETITRFGVKCIAVNGDISEYDQAVSMLAQAEAELDRSTF